MKKVLYLLVTIFMFELFHINVHASSFTITLNGDESFSDTISMDIIVNNLNGFSTGFYGLTGTLNYDKTKIELVSIAPGNNNYTVNYDKSVNDNFVILTGSGVSNGTKLATVTFSNKSLSVDDSVTISLSNMVGSNDEEDIALSGTVSKTFTCGEAAYIKGDMNKNGKIDLADIIVLLKKYLNDDATSEDLKLGDMDSDGNINLKDIILLLKEYLKS